MRDTVPQARLNYGQQAPELAKKLQELGMAIDKGGQLEPLLGYLVDIRASQMNGCAFCLDMHVKQAKIAGEREIRLHHVAIWRESPLFTAKERAALALTEALTHIAPTGVSDAIYAEASGQFDDKALVALVFRIMTINAWNRANVAFHTPPGILDKMYGLDKAGLG